MRLDGFALTLLEALSLREAVADRRSCGV